MENIVNCGDFNFFNEPLIARKNVPAMLCTARFIANVTATNRYFFSCCFYKKGKNPSQAKKNVFEKCF